MRKILLFFILMSSFVLAKSQSPQLKELWKLYENKKYNEIIEKGEKLLAKDSNNVEYNYWVGVGYYKKELIIKSIPFLEKATLHDDPHSSIRARADMLLGVCYFFQDEKVKSKESLLNGKKIKTYKKINEGNEFWFERLGFDEFYSNWSTSESEHFRFYFQDTTDINHTRFINDCEKAYRNIDTFFVCKLPKKIDYYVWASHVDAQNIIKSNLSFAHSFLCLIHGGNYESEGHEIAHVVSLFYKDNIKNFKFITEGTASYFDQTNLNREQWTKQVIKDKNIKEVEIKKVWENWNDFNSVYSYNIGGLFVQDLIKKYGREKFLEFYSDQSYKNAKLVFGKDFDDFIKEFEAKFN